MTTLFGPPESAMDLSHIDDKMEIGTSPYPQMDDIDFDFEPDRQHSIDRSMADDIENTGNNTDPMQADGEDLFKDDDMLDEEEETMQQSYDNTKEDLNMDFYNDENANDQDGEIIYEEEGSVDMNEHPENQPFDRNVPGTENNYNEGATQPLEEMQAKDHVQNLDLSNTNQHPEESQPVENVETKLETNTDTNETSTHVGGDAVAETEIVDFATQESTSTAQQANNLTDDHTDDAILQTNQEQITQPNHREILDELKNNEPSIPNVSESENTGQVIEQPAVENLEDREAKEEENEPNETAESLHPVTVVYLGQEMSFFPPMAEDTSATFFLSDTNLAYEPMERLLASCRDILGDTLEHDDELVLDVPALGLHICEDSKYASQVTLSQIVDVYLMLSRNESFNNIEPLYCSLSSRVCLASQYAYLAASASEGKTYTEIAADYVDSPEDQQDLGDPQLDVTQDVATATDESENLVQPDAAHNVQGESTVQEELIEPTQNYTTSNVSQTTVQASLQSSDEAEATADHTDDEELHVDVPETLRQHQDPSENETHTEQENVDDEDHARDQEEITESYGEPEQAEDASVSSHTVEEEVATEPSEQLLLNSKGANSNVDDIEPVEEQTYNESDVLHLGDGLLGENMVNQQAEDHENQDESVTFNQEADNIVNGNRHESNLLASKDEINYDELEFDENAELFEDKDEIEGFDDLDVLKAEDVIAFNPVTPSKQNGSKRKAADDEDELDLLDLSTPEPKRSRAL